MYHHAKPENEILETDGGKGRFQTPVQEVDEEEEAGEEVEADGEEEVDDEEGWRGAKNIEKDTGAGREPEGRAEEDEDSDKHMGDLEGELDEDVTSGEEDECMDEDSPPLQSMPRSRWSLREKQPGSAQKRKISSYKALSSKKGRKKTKKDEWNSAQQPGENQHSITLENKTQCEVILGHEIAAYDINGLEHKFRPRLNLRADVSLVQAFAEDVQRIYVEADSGQRVPLHVHCSKNPENKRSVLQGFTKSQFDRLKPQELQQVLRSHHLVISNENVPLSFDEQGLKTLEKTMTSLISIEDQSISAEVTSDYNREKIGTLAQLLAASSQEKGPNLSALDFPMSLCGVTRSTYSSELEAWFETQDRPFCRNATYPVSNMYWGTATTTGVRSWLRINCEGRATKICVRSGAQWVVLGRPALRDDDMNTVQPDHHFFSGFAAEDATSGEWEYEAVYLAAGTTLIMKPNTPHMPKHPIRYVLWNRTLSSNGRNSTHLPNLSDIDGVVEFLNPLPHWHIRQTEMASLRMEQYDDNTIPKEDRRRIVYGRGLALELIRWLDSRYILQKAEEDEENSSHPSGNVDDEENIMTIQDFELHYLIRQGICIATYNKQWLQEQEERADGGMDVDEAEVDDAQEQEEDEGYKQKEVPIPSSALEQQLKWAMTAVPWMNDTWGKFSKDLEAESSEGSHDMDMRCQGTKKFNPVRRPAPDPSYQPWSFQEIYDNGLTPGDDCYFLGEELFWPVVTNKTRTRAPKRRLDDSSANPPKEQKDACDLTSPPSREFVPASPPIWPAVLPSPPPTKEVTPASPPRPPSNLTGLVPPATTPATQFLGNYSNELTRGRPHGADSHLTAHIFCEQGHYIGGIHLFPDGRPPTFRWRRFDSMWSWRTIWSMRRRMIPIWYLTIYQAVLILEVWFLAFRHQWQNFAPIIVLVPLFFGVGAWVQPVGRARYEFHKHLNYSTSLHHWLLGGVAGLNRNPEA
ncbi:hypothetical protein BJ912DRAFT_923910 [Pholiota molesta]|nr:hypothetical protein BJ912DRAFT_923910 [Pholiota molesta]